MPRLSPGRVRAALLAATRERKSRRLAELGDRLEREAALRTATLQLSRTGVCVLDGSRELAFANDAWVRLGSTSFGAVADRVLRGEPAVHESDGRVLRFSTARLPSGEVVVSVDDVTDEVRERETRDRFLAEVVRAQDLEARRIAELIHDDAVQQLTALSMRLELAAMQRSDQTLELLALEAGRITGSLRRLLVDLHPVVLESRGLGAAIETAAAGPRALGIEVQVAPFEHRLGPELEQLGYRLVQEALANVLKHARATRVEIAVELEDGVLRCRVDDDGVGVGDGAVATALRRGSLGLHLVRERTELAGGSFRLEPREGGGSRFSFELPVRDAADPRAGERTEVHA